MSSESESDNNELIENSGGEEDDGNDVDDKEEPEETNGNDKEITWHDLVRNTSSTRIQFQFIYIVNAFPIATEFG